VSAEEINGAEYDDAHNYQPLNKEIKPSNRKASSKQVNFIKKLAQDKGVDDNLLSKMLEKGFNVSSVQTN